MVDVFLKPVERLTKTGKKICFELVVNDKRVLKALETRACDDAANELAAWEAEAQEEGGFDRHD